MPVSGVPLEDVNFAGRSVITVEVTTVWTREKLNRYSL